MTLKEMMKKVETYNEVAYIMGTDKAKLTLEDGLFRISCSTFSELRKEIRTNYIKGYADVLLKANTFELDKDVEITWDMYGKTRSHIVETRVYTA